MAAPAAAAAAGIVTGAVQGGIGISSMIANTIQNYKARMLNEEIAREQMAYEKELNNTLMQREDTAVQRRAADLAKAGINPMLAGLGGASATPGSIINPMPQQPITTDATAAINGLEGLRSSLGQLQAEKAAESSQATEIEAQLELQRRQINASNLADDKKYKADRQIEELQSLHRIIEARLNARDTAEQNKLDRDLQWKITTHKALRELFTNSEVPFLDNIWKELIDNTPEDLIEDGKLNFKALKREWDELWKAKGPEKIDTIKLKEPKPGKDEKGSYHYEYRKGRYNKVYD